MCSIDTWRMTEFMLVTLVALNYHKLEMHKNTAAGEQQMTQYKEKYIFVLFP